MTDEQEINMLKEQAKNSVPRGYVYREDGIYLTKLKDEDMEQRITNFIPVVLNKIITVDIHTNEQNEYMELAALVNRDLSGYTRLKISEIDKLDFQNVLSSKLFVDPLYKLAPKVLSTIVRLQYADAKEKKVYMANRLGFFEIEVEEQKKRGYIAGNICIGMEEFDVQISPELEGYRLLSSWYQRVYKSEEIEKYVNDILNLNRRTPVLMAYNIEAILRSLFAKAGYPIKNAIYVRGEQSTGKTTVTTLCCSMYNREDDVEKNLHNLTASEAKLNHVLNQMADTVVIIDDLRLSDSASVMRQQEQRLDNLIRVTANNVGKETMKYAYEVHGSALFTGEYALKNKSTNNRIILLEFYKEDLDKAKLSMVERNPGNLSVFFYWFIKWSIKHYEKIVSAIKENCDEYIKQRIKEEPYQERLQLHANKLVIAYKIFLDFCKDRNWNIGYQLNDFKRLMENVITAQIESLELDGREREDYVVELYSRCYDEIDSHDICMKDPKKTGWNQKLYYDQASELVYIPSATVEDFLNELKAPVSVYTVMNDFESLGLLNTDNSKQHTRTKKCARKRCYVISFDKWTDYVREVVERENQ